MADKAKAAEAKAKGNTAFQAKDYEEAIKHFTEAIAHDPSEHVFFSNRSACYASLGDYEKALADGTECVRLKPDWPKGYSRKGLAQHFLKKYDDAAETYRAGLKLAPDDAGLREGLQQVMDAKYDVPGSSPSGEGGLFGSFNPAALMKAAEKNPKIKEYMQDKALMQQLNLAMSAGSNPMQQQLLMSIIQKDPRLLELVMAMQGLDISTMNADDLEPPKDVKAPPAKKEEPKKEPPPDERTPEQKQADEFKAKGNELYKKKQFAEAISMYDKAIELEPNDLVYYNNKCAVWIEMGEENYDKVLDCCQDLLNRRYEINSANPGGASFEKAAKVMVRIASIYEKRKDFDQAIHYLNKALTEDNNRTTRNQLREVERLREKHIKELEYDPVKAEEHREKGNEFFKNQEWVKAKAEYDEAIKRNPKDAKLYSNRAAALTKLMACPDALRDLDECLKLDPKFVKAYSRKGAAHFLMKEYNKALKAYDDGLKIEPGNEECKNGKEQVILTIQQNNASGTVDEEQIRHAMADPEIQKILHDPQISMLLKQMQENPKEANAMINKDPRIREAVTKLMAAGILRTG